MTRLFKPLVIVIIAASLVAYLVLTIFSVKNVSLSPQNCLSENDLQVIGKFIFGIDPNLQEGKLKERFACLDQVKITKLYPSKLAVVAITKTPSVAIADTKLGITPEGLIAPSFGNDLPKLFVSSQTDQFMPNQKVTGTILFAAKLAQLLAKTDFHVAIIRLTGENEIVAYDAGQTVIVFSIQKSAKIQVDSLQQVLSAAKIDGAKLAKIDLRFDKPVVTFK